MWGVLCPGWEVSLSPVLDRNDTQQQLAAAEEERKERRHLVASELEELREVFL